MVGRGVPDEDGRLVPGWYADPEGRYEARWYDGTAWSNVVRHDGASIVTELPQPVAAHLRSSARRTHNAIGPGFAIYVLGTVVVLGSLLQPWLGGLGVFDLAGGTLRAGHALQVQVAVNVAYLVLIATFTCLPHQPGRLLGFLAAGVIGLLVCWTPVADRSTSKRSNYVGAFVLGVQLAVVWIYLRRLLALGAPFHGSAVGGGPITYSAGYAIVITGALLGRTTVQD